MEPRSTDEIYEEIEKALPIDFLAKACWRIVFDNEQEKDKFFTRIQYVSKRYAYLVQANPKRRTQGKQLELLKDYKLALQKLRETHDLIYIDNPTEAKLYAALRTEYEPLPLLTQQEISTHINPSGYSMGSFFTFIDLLAKACDSAASKDVGNDNADLSKDFILGWLVGIRMVWPKNSTLRFAIGDYDKESGSYRSPAADVLHEIFAKIDISVERKYIANLMREIIKDDIRQPPAFYLLGSDSYLQGQPIVSDG